MIAAKDKLADVGTSQTSAKARFTAHSFDVLIERINSMPEILERDWRELVTSEFAVSSDQARSLVDATPERVDELQMYFGKLAKYVRRGGKIVGRIVRIPPEEQTPQAVHAVHIELVELPPPAPAIESAGVPKMLRIAHCDADCRNWKWNSL